MAKTGAKAGKPRSRRAPRRWLLRLAALWLAALWRAALLWLAAPLLGKVWRRVGVKLTYSVDGRLRDRDRRGRRPGPGIRRRRRHVHQAAEAIRVSP